MRIPSAASQIVIVILDNVCCVTDSDCNTGQCCNNYHGPMIVSKRVCENYKVMDDYCSPLEKMNGHCSCGPGLSCQFVPASTTMSAKRKIYMPGPGSYKCI
ncbi:hypothetical protein KUTeg_003229 [Tegillarca granosa]|uniref:Uncharacterized protein n=1 Tax=Tegillarca granosa TaxID=220873 RepID=A0ABQ9FLJ4_TEGGR|nr:hypothetical protein KUTeg_003229 [Tegillarca granosa]